MAKVKKTKKVQKSTRAQRSKVNKATHARTQATRERDRLVEAGKRMAKKAAAAPDVTPYPRAGRKVTEFEEALDAQLGGNIAGPGSAASPQTASSPAEPPDLDAKVIGQVCQIPFDLWSVSQGVDGLKLTDKEAQMMGKPAKQLLDHYVPQIPTIAWAWISLAVVAYSAMKSRLMLIQQLKTSRAEVAEQRGSQTQEHGGSPPPQPSATTTFPTMAAIKKDAGSAA